MGPFDAFTGQPVKDAAEQSRAYLTQTGTNLINSTATAAQGAGNILKDQYGLASGNLGTGYNTATGAINAGAGSASDYLGQGNSAALGTLQAGGGAYQPLSALASRYGQGANLYSDALGINGAGGNERALAAYTAGPGYTEGLDSGIDALNRRANAAGMLQGGNANRDAIKFGIDYNNQQGYGKWLDRLAGFNPLELSATGGAAAGNQGNNLAIANLQNTGGQDQARVALGQGQNLADIARQHYGGQAGLDTGYGSAAAGNITDANKTGVGIGMGIAPQVGKTYMDAGDAAMQGSKNMWGLGLNLAKLAVGGAGGLSGLGSLFSGPSGGTDYAGLGGWK